MKIRHRVVKSIRDFFDNNDFILIDSPIFTSNAVEGTTNLFEVDYFERSAFLTQSGQFIKKLEQQHLIKHIVLDLALEPKNLKPVVT